MKKIIAVFSLLCLMTVSAFAADGVDLTASLFHEWTGVGADATVKTENVYGACVLNESTGLPYGHGSVPSLYYADLSSYGTLVVTASSGEPRFMFNRAANDGDIAIEFPRDKSSKAYETVTDNGDGTTTYTVNLQAIVNEAGYAHLNGIKGANYANVTVTSMKLYSVESTGTAFSMITQDDDTAAKCTYSALSGGGYSYTTTSTGQNVIFKNKNVNVSGYSQFKITFAEATDDILYFSVGGSPITITAHSNAYTYSIPSGTTKLDEITLVAVGSGRTIKISSAQLLNDDSNTKTVTVDGTARSYYLYIPDGVGENPALVFSLHGAGGHSSDYSPFGKTEADSKKCVVVYPQGLDQYFAVFGGNVPGWNATGENNEDIKFFKAIIEDVQKYHAIDTKRVYCCGFSNGGMMTYAAANAASDVFAAFAAISGFPMNEFHHRHSGATPRPFLHIQGKEDSFVKYEYMPTIRDNMVARLGANPIATTTTVAGKYTKNVYAAGTNGFPYVYYEIEGMGHSGYTSYTEDNNSTLTMWNFFNQYTLDSECDATLKWNPNLDKDGFTPADHGWTVTSDSKTLKYGDATPTANPNVSHSLQFEKGDYQLRFQTTGTAGNKITINLKNVDGKEVFTKEATVGQKQYISYSIPAYGEYTITITKASASDKFTTLGAYMTTTAWDGATDVDASSETPAETNTYKLGTTLTWDEIKTGQKSFALVQNGYVLCKTSDGLRAIQVENITSSDAFLFKAEEGTGDLASNYYLNLFDNSEASQGYVNASVWSHAFLSGKNSQNGEKVNGMLWTIEQTSTGKYSIRNLGVSQGNYNVDPNDETKVVDNTSKGYLKVTTEGYWANHAQWTNSTASEWQLYTLTSAGEETVEESYTPSTYGRRPIDNKHPMWLVHVDVWNQADPQKIIDLIPDDIKPYVVMNLSLSCSYDTADDIYMRPQSAIKTYKSWGSVCQQNGMWFTCQPASGGHTHIMDDDLETFEYFFKAYPNFLGWNYAEQFWGFNEAGDKSSTSDETRIELFAKLIPMHAQYGGFLTISFCGMEYSHHLNPVGMLKRNANLLKASEDYPDAILWLYKYTHPKDFYNNESVTFGPFVAGLANNYGVRYDNCGYTDALHNIYPKSKYPDYYDSNGNFNSPIKYPTAAGIGTVMEQMAQNGGAVWDGPELIWTEDFQNLATSNVDGYTQRNWGTFPGFRNIWIDMFRKVIDGTIYIPTQKEVQAKTKIAIVNDVTSGSNEDKYATWADLYDNLYKVDDPLNTTWVNTSHSVGQLDNNLSYQKSSGRYGTIPMMPELYTTDAKAIPTQVKKSEHSTVWSTLAAKKAAFDAAYPEVSTGDLFVSRYKNQLVTYNPYSNLGKTATDLRSAQANVPFKYNTCTSMDLTYANYSSAIVKEHRDHVDFYLNNYRTDTTTTVVDKIVINGASAKPTYTMTKRQEAVATATETWSDNVYTLEVNHMGPVDLTISCAGTGTGRASNIVSDAALSTYSAPKQPEKFVGTIIKEAEDMNYKNVQACIDNYYYQDKTIRGHAGNGIMKMGTNTAGGLTTNVKANSTASYNVTVRYSNTDKAGNVSLSVGGTTKTLALEKTATNEWKKATVAFDFTEGDNTFKLDNTNGIGIWVDQVEFTPATIAAEEFDITLGTPANGTVTSDKTKATEGTTVTLTVTPATGYILDGWKCGFTKVTPKKADDGTYTFTMPDNNVTITPIFKDISLVYQLDIASTVNSSLPEGWRTTDGTDVREYPGTNYGQGPRIFSSFTGTYTNALYWRNTSADYGKLAAYPMTLKAGKHRLSYRMAAWKGTPQYQAQILKSDDTVFATTTSATATPNADGSTTADLSATEEKTLDFTVTDAGNYVINFATTSGELLLLDCRVNALDASAYPDQKEEEEEEPETPTETNALQDMFKEWTADNATATIKNSTDCTYTIGTSTDCAYGQSNVDHLKFADLTKYGKISVTATEGTPRFFFNVGYNSENKANVYNLTITADNTEYLTKDGNTYTVDLVKIVENFGYAHLNAIKASAYNTTVTVSAIELLAAGPIDLAFTEADSKSFDSRYFHVSGEGVTYDMTTGVVTATQAGGKIYVLFNCVDLPAVQSAVLSVETNDPYSDICNTGSIYNDGTSINAWYSSRYNMQNLHQTASINNVAKDYIWNEKMGYVTKFEWNIDKAGTMKINSLTITSGSVIKTITLNAACNDGERVYGTYSSSRAWIVPEDLTVSLVGLDSQNKLDVKSYTAGDVVAANTGVMVSAPKNWASGTKGFSVRMTSMNATSVEGIENRLRPSGDSGITADGMTSADADCTYYRLTMHNGTQIGYWWGAAEGAAFTLAANKAYLAVPNGTEVKAQCMWFEEDATAIGNTVSQQEGNVMYDLSGRKVNSAQKGIYIKNGRKYVR